MEQIGGPGGLVVGVISILLLVLIPAALFLLTFTAVTCLVCITFFIFMNKVCII